MHSVQRRWLSGFVLISGLILSAPFAEGQVTLSMKEKEPMNGISESRRYTIPIEVPLGRDGLTPPLSLVYNASAGNGFLGAGWDLPVGYIMRSTHDRVDYTCDPLTSPNPCFVFMMGGAASEITPRTDLCDGCYGAPGDGVFVRFRYLNGGWEATDKTGTRYLFGRTPASRQDGPSGTFKWMLDTVTDTHQNTMTYSYYQNQSESLGEIYLNRIDYQSHSILFLRDGRSDVQIKYTPDFAVTTAYRLRTIDILTNGARVGKYELGYCGVIPSCAAGTGGSLLGSVTRYGSNGVRTLQTNLSTPEPAYFN